MNHLLDPSLRGLAEQLEQNFHDTQSNLLKVQKLKELLSGAPDPEMPWNYSVLQEKLRLRSPYITPLNIIQVVSLQRLREEEKKTPEQLAEETDAADEEYDALVARDSLYGTKRATALKDTMVITIKGIAAGMQNTG